MLFVDSVDKVITTYFKCVTNETFTYKGVEYVPKPLSVSPLILRGIDCPSQCGGCCLHFSLDYIPGEDRPESISPDLTRLVVFNDKTFPVRSDLQLDHKDHYCRHLNKENGRCGIHGVHPFSCDFELIRFFISDDSARLSQQLYGRGWQLLRIDGQRGALCSVTPKDSNSAPEVIRKLNRLKAWTDYFGITTKIPTIINWIQTGDITQALKLAADGSIISPKVGSLLGLLRERE